MNYKQYKLELILGASLLFMLLTYSFKAVSHSGMKSAQEEITQTKAQITQIIALQELWGDKKIQKRVEMLQNSVSKEKVGQFSIKSKKLTALFKELTIDELNRISNKIASLAVEIDKFHLTKGSNGYQLEITCKW